METGTIKQLCFNRFKTFSLLSVSMLFSIVLLMIRMKITHSFFYLFLVWNLFLAVIPYIITCYLMNLSKTNKISLVLWFLVWLLFLPNAPYIITDLMHLRLSKGSFLWLDILVVTSFALNGVLLFYLSILDMGQVLKPYFKKSTMGYTTTIICFLSGFGIYLGRFLRYNSWEILSNPKYLFVDIIDIIIKPFLYKEAWLFTILFGCFLNLGFWIIKSLINTNN